MFVLENIVDTEEELQDLEEVVMGLIINSGQAQLGLWRTEKGQRR